jgi:hypothetical protein
LRETVKHYLGPPIDRAADLWLRARYGRHLAKIKLPDGWARIYHVHVPKTGGTSINHEFLSLGGEDGALLYTRLWKRRRTHFLKSGDYVFVGWNVFLIEEGHYHFGFSHSPLSQLDLPDNTFVFTCLRDPVDRMLSYYRMLLDYRAGVQLSRALGWQVGWLGDSFQDFLRNVPDEWLLGQLFRFSHSLNVDAALRNLARCQEVLFTDSLSSDLPNLGRQLRLPLRKRHTRKGIAEPPLGADDLTVLRDRLGPELELWDAARSRYATR